MLFVLFAAQLAGGIVTFVYKDTFQTGIVDAMNNLMANYNTEPNAKTAWDTIQTDVMHFFA